MEPIKNANELLEYQTHTFNYTFNFINSMSLICAIQLDIPDIIHAHARPMILSDLLHALNIEPTKANHLYRLMRVLTHSGFFILSKNQENGYLLTPACRMLLKDEPTSLRPLLQVALDPALTEPWHHLSRYFKEGAKNTFEMTKGMSTFEYFEKNRSLGGSFYDAMARDAVLIGRVVVEKYGEVFQGLRSVVDVGGGTGEFPRTLMGAFPEIEWSVLDLPEVVARLQGGNNLRFVGGNMFESIPSAHAILLKWVLHNWSDDECLEILKKCKKAIPSKDEGGKVIIIDAVVEYKNLSKETVETQLFFDMLMMVFQTGKERTEQEWKKIFDDAGFSGYKITPIGWRNLIELYP